MQEAIALLREHDLLRVIDTPLDIDLEIPHVAYVEVKNPDSRALLFTRPVSRRLQREYDIPVLMNVFGSHEATNLFIGKPADTIAEEIEELLKLKPPATLGEKFGMLTRLFHLKNVFPKRLSSRGACQERIMQGEAVNLYDLPILTTWPQDGGPFITMGQVYTQSLDGERKNLGMYRLQVYDRNHLGMHWQIHKDSANFFHEYREAGEKMPVSIAIGGDPLYTWAATAPLPHGVFELLMYGFIKGESARLVKSITNDLYVPEDADFVIEGFVDPEKLRIEGPFGDHTGYYTLEEAYPQLEVHAITRKEKPVYLATVVGKPPLEDKYMGWATERIFLPLLKTTAPDLIDYVMPENGVFHNLIIAKMKTLYPGHAKQFMHAFWGVGQMSFVKHAIFVGDDAPGLESYDDLCDYILDRVQVDNLLISEGVCDALDHSSDAFAYGGKLGIDCTADNVHFPQKELLEDDALLELMQELEPTVEAIKQYKTYTKTPICLIAIDKKEPVKNLYERLEPVKKHTKLLVFVDAGKNDLNNPYMLIWRIVNNIDATRDIFLQKEFIGIDATNKGEIEGFPRRWPDDTDCDATVIEDLRERGIIDVDEDFLKRFYITKSG
ncbi:MAG TPA: menaquinone biosynthesis decarboxylase [Campylobacteraceae bacterium]|nr:menaquinone biosynthesis decarboxylase [Campylobacteraceae bacterium]